VLGISDWERTKQIHVFAVLWCPEKEKISHKKKEPTMYVLQCCGVPRRKKYLTKRKN
jgi:hypothetical protein